MSGAVFHRLDRDAVVAALRAYATEELGLRPEVRRVVLIGSIARGTWSARSDADVVVVVDSADDPGPFRSPPYLPERHLGVPVDVLVFTPDEVEGWGPRFRDVVGEGIVLYER